MASTSEVGHAKNNCENKFGFNILEKFKYR